MRGNIITDEFEWRLQLFLGFGDRDYLIMKSNLYHMVTAYTKGSVREAFIIGGRGQVLEV